MTLPRNRVTLITLGVSDLPRARRFYLDWGWTPHPNAPEGLALFQMPGLALALFALDELAGDQHRPKSELGTGAATFAQNCRDVVEVETVFQSALDAGATCLKRPEKAAWGGTSGYLADPDGHVWEIAHNPFWPLAKDGSLTLP
jgi:catechol 2,3-dioxygenase-like lactoylglutathione lyase family enzyme